MLVQEMEASQRTAKFAGPTHRRDGVGCWFGIDREPPTYRGDSGSSIHVLDRATQRHSYGDYQVQFKKGSPLGALGFPLFNKGRVRQAPKANGLVHAPGKRMPAV